MYAKIAALMLLAAVFAGGPVRRVMSSVSFVDAAPRMLLVPNAVGGWKQTAQWLYPAGLGEFQEYGQYAIEGEQATLSFDHHRLVPHNAINCFTMKAGALESRGVVTLPTVDGSARFNMARFSEGRARTVVAASQCFAGGCVENPPALGWSDVLELSFWRGLLFPDRYEAIPVNISISVNPGPSGSVSDADLDRALADFAAHLELRSARERGPIEARATP